jgi:hypothetical protein
MRILKTTTCFYLIVVIAVFIGLKLTISYANALSIKYSFNGKKTSNYFTSRETFRQENGLQHFKNNKDNSYNNKNHHKWENTLAVMKLKQMILSNAQKQIYVRTRFKL